MRSWIIVVLLAGLAVAACARSDDSSDRDRHGGVYGGVSGGVTRP